MGDRLVRKDEITGDGDYLLRRLFSEFFEKIIAKAITSASPVQQKCIPYILMRSSPSCMTPASFLVYIFKRLADVPLRRKDVFPLILIRKKLETHHRLKADSF